ncbi:MAG: aminotransferase class V-fold PLP-dependent enzyme [Halanaerobiales bacterium]
MNNISFEVIKLIETSPFRQYVIGTDTMIPVIDNRLVKYINFDNAATTPPLKVVLEAINEFAPWYSSIHRGKGYKSKLTTGLYEESRSIIADFVGADTKYHTVIFVKNTTEAINKLSYRLCNNQKKADECVVLSTDMEHHSNDLPWRDKFRLDYIELNKNGLLSLEDLETKLIKYNGKVKLVTVTGASNVTGYINPISKIAGLCHQYNARILVDGAQLVPHEPINMLKEQIDYLVFSAHKIYAPFGMGVLIGPAEYFEEGAPEYRGGGTVQVVTHKKVYWDRPPWKEEAGTPNIMGVIALAESIKKINKIGMEQISRYERELKNYTIRKMLQFPEIKLYNINYHSRTVSIIPFNIDGMSHEEVAEILARKYGIAVRNGCFCAQPYIQKLLNISDKDITKHIQNPSALHPGLVRISFGMYNQKEEVDYLIKALRIITSSLK